MINIVIDDVKQKVVEFFSQGTIHRYRPGEIIVDAGARPKGVMLVVKGVVEQYDITPEGNKLVVNVYKPTAFFPMSWALNDNSNEYFFAAAIDTELSTMPRAKVVEFVTDNPDVLVDLMRRVYRGTDALLRRLVLSLSGMAQNRLIFELLVESYRFGAEAGTGKRLVKVSQNTLASRSGLARETVSREFGKLISEKLVQRTPAGVIIDVELLEAKLNIGG